MSADAPQVECRLCGTLFPDTLRFCPNCREPSPQVHEDLLMAARLTGVSYEILLQRAWAAEGLVAVRRAARPASAPAAPEAAEPRRSRVPGGVIDRVRRQRDGAVVGCVVLLALATLGLVALLLFELLGDNGDNDPGQRGGAATTATAAPDAPPPTAAGAPQSTATDLGEQAPPTPTPRQLPLILESGQPANYADGFAARIVAYDEQVISQDPNRTPASGFHFVAIEVEICAGDQAVSVAPSDWRLELPGGDQFEAVELLAEPALAAANLPAGGCTGGWVTIEVPTEPAPLFIIHDNPGYATARFVWPG